MTPRPRIVRELAMLTGETLTTAIRRAVEQRLQRAQRERTGGSLAEELLAIGRRCAALPDQDLRSSDELLSYDKRGLPD